MTTQLAEQESEKLARAGAFGKRLVAFFALVLVVGVVGLWVSSQRAPVVLSGDDLTVATARMPRSEPLVGAPAPDITMTYDDGRVARLSDLRGKPVFINFWATWCGPCRSEMPEIVKAYEKHKDEGLVILAVNVEEGPQEVKEFTNTFKMTFPITLDTKGKVIDAYGVRAMPTSLFVDSQGIIRARWQGALTGDQLEEHLRTILP